MTRMTDYCDIACDLCSQWVPGTVAGTAEMRKLLKAEGWVLRMVRGYAQDVCPKCNKTDDQYWFKL